MIYNLFILLMKVDYGKYWRYPLTCPNCGADVNSLLTNVSKRGRPPKNSKPEIVEETKDLKIDEIEVEEVNEEDDTEDSNVDDIVEIERESESWSNFLV